MSVGRRSSDLLTTGEAAALLGSSRQHVVDLCAQGVLPCLTVGTHRRIRRSAVEQLAFGRRGPRPLTPEEPRDASREEERSLWLHYAVAGKLALDPTGVLATAQANLDRLQQQHRHRSAPWVAQWAEVLAAGATAVLDVLTSRKELAVELRQNTPFAGVLTAAERHAALAAFRRHGASGVDAIEGGGRVRRAAA